MALNFPDSPTLNEVYTDSTSGFSYQWDGSVWQSYESSTASNIQELDDISGSFNGVLTTFALTIGGQSVTPVTTNQLVISVGGVMQNPTNDFYISGSNIVFTTPPTNGLTFFGTLLGSALSLNTIADGSVTPLKLSTGGPSWNTDGDVVITGTGSTALLVNGNARVTGILTVGTSSITLNGNTDVVTASSFVGNLTGDATGLSGTPNLNVGVITATSFSGDGSGLTGVGIGTDGSVNTTGIITASSFSGDGSGLSGIAATGTLLRAPQVLTSGTSYTTPAGCNVIYVECVGGGGGGGGNTNPGLNRAAGQGGGGGGYCAKYFVVTPSTSYTYAIGAGGAGGNGAAGSAGGNTTFTVGAVTITSYGGGGGGVQGAAAGLGGISINGDLNVNGGGGTGGMADSYLIRGSGGSSFFGGNAPGGANSTSGQNGTSGGGGSGGAAYNSTSTGGNGGTGLIRIWEYS